MPLTKINQETFLLNEILWLTLISDSCKGFQLQSIIQIINICITENRASIYYRNNKPFAWLAWGDENDEGNWISFLAPYGGDESLVDEMRVSLLSQGYNIDNIEGLEERFSFREIKQYFNTTIEKVLNVKNIINQSTIKPNDYFELAWSMDLSDELEHYLKDVLALIPYSYVHQKYAFGFLLSRILPAYQYQQFYFYKMEGVPHTFLNWAWLSDERSKKYRDGDFELYFQEWAEGNILWMMEIITATGINQEVMDFCRNKFDPLTTIHYFLADPNTDFALSYNSIQLPAL